MIGYSLINGRSYNRERFYDAFLIKKGTLNGKRIQVNDGILQNDGRYKDFVPMLKQVMDHIYVVNLPEALGIQPYFPPDSGLDPFLLDQRRADMRVLTVNQLICAVDEFDDSLKNESDSILDHSMPWTDQGDQITLTRAAELRHTDTWRQYLVSLTDGKHRNRLSEVDFYNIHKIWKHYLDVMETARQRFPELGWRECEGAVSIIYRFEALTITTVYTKGKRKMQRPSEAKVKASKSLKRRIRLTIDYVCTDVLEYGLSDPLRG